MTISQDGHYTGTMSDMLTFAPAEQEPEASNGDSNWKVLIVDDEPAIHQVTKLALNRLRIENRAITFLDAYSAEEAKIVLAEHKDIAMIFLDVIMETETSGLDLVRWIRNELKNFLVRIVLRTGQPGAAPEEKVILEYDINDYKEKTELVRAKLFSTTCAALRNYKELYRLENARRHEELTREGLERVVRACANLFQSNSLHDFAAGLLQQMASLLHLHEDGMFLKAHGLSALKNDNDFTVIARAGRFESMTNGLPADVAPYVMQACEAGQSIHVDKRFVGFYPGNQGAVDIVYFEGVERFEQLDEHLIQLFGTNISAALERFLSFQKFKESQARLVLQLASLIEKRDQMDIKVNTRLIRLCHYLGTQLELSANELDMLELLAPLHDIGLLSVPGEILNKSGPLSDSEWETVRQHTERGYQLLASKDNDILQTAASIAFEHHERFDGTGYPRGLSGAKTSILGRIVGIADVFTALTTPRSYREAWSMAQATEYLKEERGKQFDPVLVDIFVNNAAAIAALLQE